jgi:excisionase family DNA binding protein
VSTGRLKPSAPVASVNELLDLYLDGLDADQRLSAKTRFDYRHYADKYVRPHLGARKVGDVTPDLVLAWQRKLAKEGSTKTARGLSANTVRLARAPLAGAFKLTVATGMVAVSPLGAAARPGAEVTPAGVADLLGVTRQFVDRLLADGALEFRRLPGSKHRRIKVGAVLALAEERDRRQRGSEAVRSALGEY